MSGWGQWSRGWQVILITPHTKAPECWYVIQSGKFIVSWEGAPTSDSLNLTPVINIPTRFLFSEFSRMTLSVNTLDAEPRTTRETAYCGKVNIWACIAIITSLYGDWTNILMPAFSRHTPGSAWYITRMLKFSYVTLLHRRLYWYGAVKGGRGQLMR